MPYLSISQRSLSKLKMPPNFPLLRALTSGTWFKTCNHFWFLERLPAVSQNPFSMKFYHVSANVCAVGKDIVAKDDILLNNLGDANSTEDVVDLLSRHLPVMNHSHQLRALTSLFETHKNSSFSMSKEDVIRKPEFKTLCSALLQRSRHMELDEQINCLKCLAYFNVSSKTKIVQSLLNLISKQVNDLSLQQIIYVDFLVGLFEVTPLVQALRIAFPIVFEVKLSKQVDESSLYILTDSFQYASHKPVSEACFNFLVSLLTSYQGSIPLKNATSILRSFCERRGSDDSHVVLLYRVLDIIAESVDELSYADTKMVLLKVLDKGCQYEFYQHQAFLDACIHKVILCDVHVKDLLYIIQKTTKASYASLPLLDQICKKIEEQPNELSETGISNTISLLQSLAFSNFKPENWNQLQKIIVDVFNKNLNVFELPWLGICLCLIVLDCWPSAILNKVFEEKFLDQFLQRENCRIDFKMLLNIYQAVQTIYPGIYTGILPPERLLEKASTYVNPQSDLPLLPALIKGLGGSEYIHSHVFTQYHHCIDHVIVMRKGGFVVATNTDNTFIEGKRTLLQDIEVPAESVIIGVLLIRPSQCTINGDRVRGYVALYQRTLEAMGVSVVPVILTKWNSLMDHEKIPYLMQELKLKATDNELMALR